jgi:hypothetical protein
MTDISTAATARSLLELRPPNPSGEGPSNQLDKDAFLKLLVAQLRYQDPLNPSDPEDFMATTAQFTTIEKLDELTQQGANNAIVTGLSMASSLVGRQVDYVGPDGIPGTSVVTSAQVVNGSVRLMTDDGPVDLATVTGIGSVSVPSDPSSAEPTAAQPTAIQPTTDQPTAIQPTTDQPTAIQPTTDQPTAIQPTTDQPTAIQPTTDQPTATEPTTESDDSLTEEDTPS